MIWPKTFKVLGLNNIRPRNFPYLLDSTPWGNERSLGSWKWVSFFSKKKLNLKLKGGAILGAMIHLLIDKGSKTFINHNLIIKKD